MVTNAARLVFQSRAFCPFVWPLGRAYAHSSQQPLQKPAPCHPQIGERKKRVQLRRVLGQSSVAHLHVAELALNDPKRVFHLGPDAGLDVFKSVEHRAHWAVLVQRPAFAWAHGHMPVGLDVLTDRNLHRSGC